MHEFHGDLLIGGMRLEHLRCELEEERHKRGCKEWTLSGHLRLTPEQSKHLELNREYRIQLDDGLRRPSRDPPHRAGPRHGSARRLRPLAGDEREIERLTLGSKRRAGRPGRE